MAELGDYLNSINVTKQNVMRNDNLDDPKAVSGFSPWIVRRLLSYHEDCIEITNEINCLPGLDEQLQYEFLLHAIPKKKRFAKLHRVPKHEHLDLVKRYYKCSDAKAMEVIGLHTDEDFVEMTAALNEGGVIISEQRRKPSAGHGRNRPGKAG